jgi:hypothetical protein
MSKKITFTNVLGWDFFPPKPAVNNLPQWYKDTSSYHTKEEKKEFSNNGENPHSIKKCMPIFDAMTAGYILYTQVDVEVKQENGKPYFIWSSQDAIGFHVVEQAPLHPNQNGAPYPKWNHPYAIKTPPGYSTLFVPPLHNPNGIFTVFPGIVDTDKYTAIVNLPFVLNDVNWTGLIEAGTPMVQIIPFKRDSWEQETGSAKDIIEEKKVSAKLRTLFYNSYKRQFWERKEYK